MAELAARLPAAQQPDDQVLIWLIRLARLPAEARRPVLAWTPMLDALVAVGGDQQATTELEPVLADLAKDPNWAALVGVLRRIIAGERGPQLLEGLDSVGAAIAAETLQRLTNP